MKKTDLSALLKNLTATLRPSQENERQQLDDLRAEIVRALAGQSEVQGAGLFFQVERTDHLEETLSEISPLGKNLEALVDEVLQGEKPPEEHLVFRRYSPIRSAQIPGSIPTWGRGAEVAFTRGPFLDVNGFRFWFDFYKVTRMVRVYFSGDPAPALLLPLRLSVIFNPQKTACDLGRGSVWIRADLFAPGTPPNTYVGLRVSDGEIRFSQPVTVVNDQVTLNSTANLELDLELDPLEFSSTYAGNSGIDVRNASLDLPASCRFALDATSLTIRDIGSGAWQIYSDTRTFSFAQGGIAYSPLLDDILIAFETEPGSFNVDGASVNSQVVSLEGEAPVISAAWSLPLTVINNPAGPVPDAFGAGGWALAFGEGIFASWLGLEQGPVDLKTSLLVFGTGQTDWISPTASTIYARQTYELWPNEYTGFHARASLQYKEQFAFRYVDVAIGIEGVATTCDTNIQTDRPVRVNGRPFEVSGKDSLFLLFDNREQRSVVLFDPNILMDNLEQTTASQNPFESHAVALNNVLLTVSQVTAFLLVGNLAQTNRLENGNLHFLHALFRLLPTLPDPYAANLALLFRLQDRRSANQPDFHYPIALLLATVSWPYLPDAENPVNAKVDYLFFPYIQQTRTFIGVETAGGMPGITPADGNPAGSGSVAVAAAAATNKDKGAYDPKAVEEPWNELIRQFGFDLFALLDVSTNADLMGVMYSPMNERFIFEITHTPFDGDAPRVPLQIQGMDLKASGRFVKAFTVPLVSWEPVLNTSPISALNADPPPGTPENPRQLLFPNDGGPTRIFNTSLKTVTLAPIPLSDFIIEQFKGSDEPLTFSIFTLPYGMQAIAQFEKKNPFAAGEEASDITFNRPAFDDDVQGGIQFKATGAYNPDQNNRNFRGNTVQLTNLLSSKPNPTSILGESVTDIFNREFSSFHKGMLIGRGVPVERIDMSGYGSSMFSNWLNDKAKFAQTSQAKFDVFTGRTAHEIIQVRSIMYPWGVGVVRTIVLFRPASGFVYRIDSGWRADSDGLFDFNVNIKVGNDALLDPGDFAAVTGFNLDINDVPTPHKAITPYEIHPGIIKGVYNVGNIQETPEIDPYTNPVAFSNISLNGLGELVAGDTQVDVKLVPVWFTADVDMAFVKQGAVKGRVPSKKMLGFIQIGPEGVPIPAADFVNLLEQNPAIGGEIDCVIDIGDSGQKMRLKRVEMDTASGAGNTPVFVGAPKGTPILPADGSWSLVQHDAGTNEVTPVADTNGLPLIQAGVLTFDPETGAGTVPVLDPNLRIANARELLQVDDDQTIHFGFLQNTGTQKVLFRRPNFDTGVTRLFSELPEYADAYHLLNSKGIFPNLADISEKLDLAAQNVGVEIIEKGFQLVDNAGAALTAPFEHAIQGGKWYWVGTENGNEPVKIFLDYSLAGTAGALNFELDSLAEKWTSDLNATTIHVDLLDISPLFLIKGNFESKSGLVPGINEPTLEFGPTLKPIADVLTLLAELSQLPNVDYAEILQKGLEIAMSNSPEVWEYKFSAKKEIPVLRFPPPAIDGPTTPLRIEASLAVGCYFNESLSLSTDVNQLIPSAGAFVEFYGQLSVMCVSIAAATVYAIGQTRVKIYADLEEGPGLEMEYGFGVELAVGLPVIGTVALKYMVGIGMIINASELQVDAFLLFQGRAEILGGIVTVTIMIEARGSINRDSNSGRTDMIAQVTFGLEISIFLVINLNFEESWQERRQIA